MSFSLIQAQYCGRFGLGNPLQNWREKENSEKNFLRLPVALLAQHAARFSLGCFAGVVIHREEGGRG